MQDILAWHIPKTIKALSGFLGLSGYYRKFVQGLASLTNLSQKSNFHWTEASTQAFRTLKKALSSTLVLSLPDYSKAFTVETDASNIGAVLTQSGKPLAYSTRPYVLKAN